MLDFERQDRPLRPESLVAVRDMLDRNSAVRGYQETSRQVFSVERIERSTVNLYVTNVYTVGTAEVYGIVDAHPSVNCILTVSVWNTYTPQAKELAKSLKVGLFRFYELMGALNFDGDKFLNYIAPRDRK